ncbi:hypothetical protein [Streptantibioticus silvisoli]|uniref:XRE family transcriptional regulator n=1 Tax=Streptantibioticus silvisoli TaxID=2705255 RepID=A0ABT6W4W5_9ACTN|nr:hypothetical protein [Streptantibioticus silvisoli]MDI5965802.1 hypothetical protein [Streptantibioticus silvisoli]
MKPLADHGTTARAKGRPAMGIPGCNCGPCRSAENSYDKRRRFLNATGRQLRLPVEPIAQHIDMLFANDAGWVQLAAAAETSQCVLSRIRRRLQPTVRRDVATRILAIQPGDAIPAGRQVAAIGSIRRIQAAMRLAHSVKAISAVTGVEHSTLSDLLTGDRTTIALHVAKRIANGYRTLVATTGDSERSRRRAANNDWHGPLAWGDNIDDPNAEPEVDDAVIIPLKRNDVAAIRRDEVLHLARFGVSPEEIHHRIGEEVGLGHVREIVRTLHCGTRDRRKKDAA